MLGSSYVLTEVALRGFDPMSLVLVRLVIGAVFLVVWMRLRGQPLPRGSRPLTLLVAIGLLNTIGSFLLVTWGQKYVTASYTAILLASNAIFAAMGAALVLPGERLTTRRAAGTLIGFAGVVVLFLDRLGWSTGHGGGRSSLYGALAILGGAISLAIVALTVRSRLPGLLPAQLALPMLLTGIVSMAVFETALEFAHELKVHAAPRPGPVLSALVLGVVNAGVGNVVYYTLIRAWGVARTALVGYVVPLVGVGLGVGLLHDRLGLNMVAGLVLITTSMLLVNPASPRAVVTSEATSNAEA
jgi:drug/metabolite transporter (DMT)-like permease